MYEEEFTRKEFVSSCDGIKDWYLTRKGKQGAPCIIMLHGHGSNGDQLVKRQDKINYQTVHLVRNDFHVISPNLRGNSWMSLAAVNDLYAILQIERPQLDWSHLYFIAGSMGGTGALIFAMHHPEVLSGVGVLGAATDLNSYVEWLDHQEDATLREINAAIRTAFPTDHERKENSVLYHPEKLTMPIQFYHGGADQIIPTPQARAFAAAMKGNQKFEYHELPSGGHDSPIPFFKEVMDKLVRQV